MKYKNLTLIGTSHIASQSIVEVHQAIVKEKPVIVAIELDRRRLAGLLSKKKKNLELKDIFKLGVKAYTFTVIASYVQRKLGRLVGVAPGSEMLEAVKLAKQTGAQIALIDQDIMVTLSKFSKAFGWKEKWHFFVDIVRGIFFKKSEMKKMGITNMDLTKVPSQTVINKLIKNVKVRYPSLYKVLIKERNIVMARNLAVLMKKYPGNNIVAVIGAGHEEDLLVLIKKFEKSKIEIVSA